MRENGRDVHSDLYAPIEPHARGRLEVDRRHNLYWEVSGNPEGLPVVFLHGGPGAGASPEHRRFFDPAHYRIVVFDQRGAGRSRPLAAVEDNTTGHLVADMEALRQHLGIQQWQVFGGSWGSTLAMAYAQSHPERVTALVLRGVFLCRPREIEWFLWGMARFHPEAWRKFIEFLPPAERADPLESYYRRLTDPRAAVHQPAAQAWSIYEGTCSTLHPNKAALQGFAEPTAALGLARLEAHYFRNGGFMAEDLLLREVDRIRHIPTTIVQGRHDIICPIETADELSRAWPEAEYVVIAGAGHSAMEPGIRRALVSATDRLRTLTPRRQSG